MRMHEAGTIPEEVRVRRGCIELALTLFLKLHVTAVTLFESLDPYLVWRQLFLALQSRFIDKEGHPDDTLDLLAFVIHTFRLTEDEVAKLHAPLLAFASIDLVRANNTDVGEADKILAVDIAHALLKETSPTFFTTSEREDASITSDGCGLSIPGQFYSAENNKSAKIPSSGFAQRLIRNGLSSLLDITQRALSVDGKDTEMLPSALNALSFLAEQLPRDQPVELSWQPENWLETFLRGLVQREAPLPFEAVESAIQALIALQSAPITPNIILDRRTTLSMLVNLVLGYLRPEQSAFHMQAVALIWALEDLSKYKHVEAAICQGLTAKDLRTRSAAYEAFGNLWRFSDDSLLPASRLSIPMRMMLDALRSDDLSTRRVGEAWMRCSVKSYLK